MNVVIIGGGVMGLLTALELVRAGCQVTIIEKNDFAQQSSWAGGGIISPLYPWRYPSAVSALAQWAQAAYPQLAQQLVELTGIDVELNRCGMLMLEAQDHRDALVWAQQYQQSITPLTKADIQQLSPLLNQFEQGLWLPHIANVRNPRLLKALIQAVKILGVNCISQAEVKEWHMTQGRVQAVETIHGQYYQADHFVLTTGAWTGQVLNKLDVKVAIRPIKGQMILYKLPQQLLAQIVLYQGHYLIPRQDGHILCGSTLEDTQFDKTTTAEAKEKLIHVATHLLPLLAKETPIRHWAGLRPASPNGIPYIGRVPSLANMWVNAGQFRNGLVLAPASARLLADLLLQRQPCVDARPYQLA